jgi:hypothetical protein
VTFCVKGYVFGVPFTQKVTCLNCGKTYRRKTNNAGTPYQRIAWVCNTFNIRGKSACPSQQIPESVLESKSAEVLGLAQFDAGVFAEKISAVQIPAKYRIIFVFTDGNTIEAEWEHRSRRESWTPEMKQAMRELKLKNNKRREETHESNE